jgi:DNA-binding GntR family transcriptional regulator
MNEFEVSAITVRRALRELSYEGLIRGHQGLGVFVKEKPKIHRVLAGDPQRSIGDEIARAGFTPRLVEIGHLQIEADEELAARLAVAPGTKLFRHEKMTYADADPVAYHVTHMALKIAQMLGKDLGREFLFRVLAEHNIEVATLKCEFSAVTTSESLSRLLAVSAGTPLMRVDYTALSREGKPILLGQTICRADRFIFEVSLPRDLPRNLPRNLPRGQPRAVPSRPPGQRKR